MLSISSVIIPSSQKKGKRTREEEEEKEETILAPTSVKRVCPDALAEREDVLVYTDGACKNNGKTTTSKAGIGIHFPENTTLDVGEHFDGQGGRITNQRAELWALYRGVELVSKNPSFNNRKRIILHSDSEYAIRCLDGTWMRSWKTNNFKGGKVLNRDLIEPIFASFEKYKREHGVAIVMKWVKGHTSVQDGNYYADQLANRGAFSGGKK